MNNTVSVNTTTQSTNDNTTIYVLEEQPSNKHKSWKEHCVYMAASAVLTVSLSFVAGYYSAASDLTEYPAEVTAAMIKEVI